MALFVMKPEVKQLNVEESTWWSQHQSTVGPFGMGDQISVSSAQGSNPGEMSRTDYPDLRQ